MVNISESEWMEVPLVPNWDKHYKAGQAKNYPLGTKDREVVDKQFDKYHEQGRMEWNTEVTPFLYPCFLVWRVLPNGTKKERVVMDIRALNRITIPDAYPLPMQSDILAVIRGAKYISTIDCAFFFHQWRVKKAHRHCLTMISHHGCNGQGPIE